jgi:hypothetical protein
VEGGDVAEALGDAPDVDGGHVPAISPSSYISSHLGTRAVLWAPGERLSPILRSVDLWPSWTAGPV